MANHAHLAHRARPHRVTQRFFEGSGLMPMIAVCAACAVCIVVGAMATGDAWRWLAAYFVLMAVWFGCLRLPLLPMITVPVISSALVLRHLNAHDAVEPLMIALTAVMHLLGIGVWLSDRWHDRLLVEQAAARDKIAALERQYAHTARTTRRALVHDIRQPMAALSLQMGFIQRRLHEDNASAFSDAVQTLSFAFDALKGQVDEFAREDKPALASTPLAFAAVQQVQVHEVARMMVQLHGPLAQSAGIKLELHCATNTADCVGMSNMNHLTRTLQCLLSHAIHYHIRGRDYGQAPRQPAERPARMRITCRVRGHLYLVHVGTTGCGAPPAPESDMGLNDARRLVDGLPDHSLELRSRAHHYTMFQLAFPARRVNRPRTLSRALKDTGVLVVENDTLVRTAITEVFELAGAQVMSATDTQQAMEHVTQGKWMVELLVCDYGLDGQRTGLDLIRQVRRKVQGQAQSQANLPALIVTGYPGDLPDVSDEAITVLAKPFDAHTLSTHAARLVHEFRNAQPLA